MEQANNLLQVYTEIVWSLCVAPASNVDINYDYSQTCARTTLRLGSNNVPNVQSFDNFHTTFISNQNF